MPFPTDPNKYPSEFKLLFDRAQRESFEVDLGDHKQALSQRHKLHAYRRAAESAQIPGYLLMRNITLKVLGTRIVFDNNSEMLSALREAAGIPEPKESDIDTYLAQAFDGDKDESNDIRESVNREQEVREQESQEKEKVVLEWQELFGIKESSNNPNEE